MSYFNPNVSELLKPRYYRRFSSLLSSIVGGLVEDYARANKVDLTSTHVDYSTDIRGRTEPEPRVFSSVERERFRENGIAIGSDYPGFLIRLGRNPFLASGTTSDDNIDPRERVYYPYASTVFAELHNAPESNTYIVAFESIDGIEALRRFFIDNPILIDDVIQIEDTVVQVASGAIFLVYRDPKVAPVLLYEFGNPQYRSEANRAFPESVDIPIGLLDPGTPSSQTLHVRMSFWRRPSSSASTVLALKTSAPGQPRSPGRHGRAVRNLLRRAKVCVSEAGSFVSSASRLVQGSSGWNMRITRCQAKVSRRLARLLSVLSSSLKGESERPRSANSAVALAHQQIDEIIGLLQTCISLLPSRQGGVRRIAGFWTQAIERLIRAKKILADLR